MGAGGPDPRRRLPAVGALLDSPAFAALTALHPRAVVTDALREAIADAREGAASAGHLAAAGRGEDPAEWARRVERVLARSGQPSLRRVLNATGVVLHTNLGRAPLAAAALDAVHECAAGYSNVEYDLARGERGSRYTHCAALLRELTGAGDALVVNNCAAALVLALNSLAAGAGVAVSRGELVEIGGSFRVPEIMERSGARLVEVGTTNRTHAADYVAALDAGAAAIVKVHRSNFAISGYTAEASLAELAALADARGVPLVHDFGSGLLLDLAPFGLAGEPTVCDAVASGASLVVMSGDKLLGGPQAGIVLGRPELVARLRANPLARALRVDKLTLAALEATLALYRDPARARREIPALAMLTAPADELHERATRVAATLAGAGHAATVVPSEGAVGGGAFPTARLSSWAVAPAGDAAVLVERLRAGRPPVVARVADGRLLVDLRSVPPADDAALAEALCAALA
ncbi:MAG TPA: L-seryl-tRNA(Sec) selenium transferase [Gemmatimonadaceae bacterium]|nr:L-seryl-tRNA(Sec) selenium transferase [Gemmatimonadaceae bacterium]